METSTNNTVHTVTEQDNPTPEPNTDTPELSSPVVDNVAPPDLEMEKANKKATAGMVLGLISIAGWLLPLIGFPLTVLAIIFGALGLKSAVHKKRALAGLVLGIVFFILTLINSIVGAVIGVMSAM